MQPTRGGEEGTKSMDLMTIYSMLSHGAKKNLVDAHQKSEMNDEYWRALEMGRALPPPHPTFAFNKFMNLLRGAGINPEKKGSEIVLGPMTDADVKKLSNGKISEYNFLLGKDLSPKKGGFFDTGITGGVLGKRYSHMELPEALPNPIFERAITSLTGISYDHYRDVLNGTKHVDDSGKLLAKAAPGTKTGGAGIATLLRHIDVDGGIAKIKASLKTAKEGELNELNKRLRYLTALKDLNLRPEEAYMRKMIPVIPPEHRPVYDMPGRGLVVSPANYLYQRAGILSQAHDYPVMKLLHDDEKKQLRDDTYSSDARHCRPRARAHQGSRSAPRGICVADLGQQSKDGLLPAKSGRVSAKTWLVIAVASSRRAPISPTTRLASQRRWRGRSSTLHA